MRISTNKHSCLIVRCALWLGLATAACPLAAQQSPDFTITRENMVAIRADTAWEDIEPETIRFQGHFELRSGDMHLLAEQATVRGSLDDPASMHLQGAPARISLLQEGKETAAAISAEADSIDYQRDDGTVILSGNAQLRQAGNTMLSSRIVYDIERGRFRAEGDEGVQLNLRIDN